MKKEKRKLGSGGKRDGAGAKLKYGEDTVRKVLSVPRSKESEVMVEFEKVLKKYIKIKIIIYIMLSSSIMFY